MCSDSSNPQKGAICVYQNGDHGKLGVVTGASSIPGWSRFAPVHTFPECATDKDLIVPPAISGLTYTIVLPTDLATTLPNHTLIRTVAALPTSVLSKRPTTTSEEQQVSYGTRTLGPLDARLDLRRAERRELAEIASTHLDDLLRELHELESGTAGTPPRPR